MGFGAGGRLGKRPVAASKECGGGRRQENPVRVKPVLSELRRLRAAEDEEDADAGNGARGYAR